VAVVRVVVLLGSNCPIGGSVLGGSCSGGSYARWQLSQVAVALGGNCPGCGCLVEVV